jgi:hypothetical protein
VFIGFFALAVVLFLHLARTTAIIRDPSSLPDPTKRPYSLGRTQMALWFFTIVASYFFIWMVTSDYETISGTALVLMGISAGTGLGAQAVDKTKDHAKKKTIRNFREERTALQARLKILTESLKTASEPYKSSWITKRMIRTLEGSR